MIVNRLAVDLFSEDRVTSFADAYAAGVRLVILKATEGATVQDHTYASRLAAAKAAGMMVGSYHFMRWTPIDDQIANFLSVADTSNPLIMDWETNDASLAMARAFLTKLDAKIGRPTIVYSYASFLQEQLGSTADTFFGSHPLWLAAYRSTPPKPQVSWDKCLLWQNTENAVIPGLPGVGGVDASHFDGTEADLRAAWLGKAIPAPQPAPPAPSSPIDEWKAIQARLVALGLYSAAVDGDPGQKTRAALNAALVQLTKEPTT